MTTTVSDETLKKLIIDIDNPLEPTRSYESVETLKRWLDDPLLQLTESQRTLIKDVVTER